MNKSHTRHREKFRQMIKQTSKLGKSDECIKKILIYNRSRRLEHFARLSSTSRALKCDNAIRCDNCQQQSLTINKRIVFKYYLIDYIATKKVQIVNVCGGGGY